MVEHPAVNGRVVGSSPTPGEIQKTVERGASHLRGSR